jgi:hypothetical protein
MSSELYNLIILTRRLRHVLRLLKTLIRISINKLTDVVNVTNIIVDENVTVNTTYIDNNNNIFGF